jgi:DNA polymerase III sliding clamp (beta) subunit (PCNA family)
MKAFFEFVPQHLDRILDIARRISNYAVFDFGVDGVRIRTTDTGKTMYLETRIASSTYKCDEEFQFVVALEFFYPMVRTLDATQATTVEADETFMRLQQSDGKTHVLGAETNVRFELPHYVLPEDGIRIRINAKQFQRYLRSIARISPMVTLSVRKDKMTMETVNSQYRTSLALEATFQGEGGTNPYAVKLLDTLVHTGLGKDLDMRFQPDCLYICYEDNTFVMLGRGVEGNA